MWLVWVVKKTNARKKRNRIAESHWKEITTFERGVITRRYRPNTDNGEGLPGINSVPAVGRQKTEGF